MNVELGAVIQLVLDYIETKAVGIYAPLSKNIFTGPHEERANKAKMYAVLEMEKTSHHYELGYSEKLVKYPFTITLGYRDDRKSIVGTEKETADTYFGDFTRYLESREFIYYMAANGVKCPGNHTQRAWDDKFFPTQKGLRRYKITLELWSYIDTGLPIP